MFDQFLNSPDPLISSRAEKLDNYTQLLKAGSLSKSEYDDLCRDLLRLDQISQLATSIEEQEALQEAFEAMLKIATSIPMP